MCCLSVSLSQLSACGEYEPCRNYSDVVGKEVLVGVALFMIRNPILYPV